MDRIQMLNPNTHPKLILIDDDREFSHLLRLRLKDQFEVVGEFTDARNALLELPHTKPDVALVDLNIDGKLDGVDCIRELAAHHPEIVVMAVTSESYTEAIEAALQAGARCHIRKPVDTDQLIDSIQYQLRLRDEQVEHQGRPEGQLWTFQPFAPEVGQTSLVASMAREAALHSKRILAVDLTPDSSPLAFALGLTGQGPTLSDWIQSGEQRPASELALELEICPQSGVHLLPLGEGGMDHLSVMRMLFAMMDAFDTTLIDVPFLLRRNWTDLNTYARRVFLVADDHEASLHRLQFRIGSLLEDFTLSHKLVPVLARSNGLSEELAWFEEILERQSELIAGTLPEVKEAAQRARENGRPLSSYSPEYRRKILGLLTPLEDGKTSAQLVQELSPPSAPPPRSFLGKIVDIITGPPKRPEGFQSSRH